MPDRKYTNNEIRQNILAQIEQSKAFMALAQAELCVSNMRENNPDPDLCTIRTHAYRVQEAVDNYISIPANDEVCTFDFYSRKKTL